jgi:hypothetical protein
MRPARRPNTVRGLALLLPYPVLSATVDVYAGHGEQALDPAVVAAVAFTLTVTLFAVLGATARVTYPPDGRGGPAPGPVRTLRTHPAGVLAINISTVLTWIPLLYALKFLEPAVVNAVSLAIGPAVTALASPVLRRGTCVLGAESRVSAAVLAVIVVLCWGSAAGLTSIGHVGLGRATAGLAATLLSGLGSAGTFIYAKRLSEAGVSPASALSSRFYLTTGVAWVIGRLRPSVFSLLGIAAITSLIGAGVAVRARHDARPATAGGTVGASSRGART